MESLGESVLVLKTEFNNFVAGINTAKAEADKLDARLSATQDLAQSIGTAFAAAGAAIVGSMLAMTKSAADYGEQIKNVAQKTGVSAENFAKWSFAAEQNEATTDALSTGLKFLSKNIQAAINAAGDQRSSFQDLGITTKDLQNAHGDLNKLLPLVADRMKGIHDPTEKTSLMMQIFGKAGADLIPVMDLGSKGLLEYGKQATDLHLVMSGKNAEDFDNLGDTTKQITDAFRGLSVEVGTALAPLLTGLAEQVRDGVKAAADFAREHKGVTEALLGVGAVLATGGTLMLGVAGILAALPLVAGGLTLVGGAAGIASLALAALPFAAIAVGAAAAIKVLYDLNATMENNAAAAKSVSNAHTIQQGNLEKSIENLKKLGIEYDSSGKSTELVDKEVRQLTQSYYKSHPAIQQHKEDHKQTREELKAAEEAQKKYAAALKDARDSILHTSDADKAWLRTLHDLYDSGQLSIDQIKAMKGKLNDLKDANDPLVNSLNDYLRIQAYVKKANESWSEDMQTANNLLGKELKVSMDHSLIGLNDLSVAATLNAVALDSINAAGIKTASSTYPTINLQVQGLITAFHDYNNMALNTERINNAVAASLGEPMLANAIAWTEKTAKAHKDAAEAMQHEYETAIGNVTSGMAKGFADMILGEGNWKQDMISGAKSAAEGMLSAFFSGLLSPLTSALGNIGKGLANTLTGLFTGGSGSGGTGLGSIFGGGGGSGGLFSGLFGTGAAGAGAVGSATLPTILMPNGSIIPGMTVGGASTGAGTGLAATLGKVAPFASAAIAVLSGLMTLKFSANDVADVWVNNVQNPFGEALGKLVNGFDAAKANGSLTPEMATDALKGVNDLWALYSQKEDQFVPKWSGWGYSNVKDNLHKHEMTPEERLKTWQGVVVKQSHTTLDPLMKQIFADLTSSLPSLDVGMPYVHHDMIAKIHQGEAVLTKSENSARLAGAGSTINVGGFTFNITGAEIKDETALKGLARRIRTHIARELKDLTNYNGYTLEPAR